MNDSSTHEGPVTAQEMIEYLQGFPPESELKILVIDSHGERKYFYPIENVTMITDGEVPAVFLDIDKRDAVDITKGAEECSE